MTIGRHAPRRAVVVEPLGLHASLWWPVFGEDQA